MMLASVLPWVGDVLVIFSLVILTLAVYGIFRMPDLYSSLQAASLGSIMAVTPILLVLILTFQPHLITRSLMIIAFFIVTAPVSSHVIARAAYLTGEPLCSPDAYDETDSLAITPSSEGFTRRSHP